jgi:membrane-associated phospholipid phosphatase
MLMRRRAINLAAAFLAASLSLCAATASADDGEGLQWNPRFTRFSTSQYGLSAALLGGVFASDFWLQPASGPGWRGDNVVDHQARSLLSASSEAGRSRAGQVSDYLAFGILAYPFVVDTALVAGLGHGNYDVAFQMAMIGTQAVLTAKLVSGLTKGLVGRARPDSAGCVNGDEPGCGTHNESFISGHTTSAFVGAGLICAQHQNLALYGDSALGAITCGASLAIATAAGTLRIVADRHNLTDVLGGALVGLGAGYLMPNLLNYNFGADRGEGGQIAPFADDRSVGVVYSRVF